MAFYKANEDISTFKNLLLKCCYAPNLNLAKEKYIRDFHRGIIILFWSQGLKVTSQKDCNPKNFVLVQVQQIHYANQLGERPWFDYPLELNLRTCSFADLLLAKTDTSLTSSNIILFEAKRPSMEAF